MTLSPVPMDAHGHPNRPMGSPWVPMGLPGLLFNGPVGGDHARPCLPMGTNGFIVATTVYGHPWSRPWDPIGVYRGSMTLPHGRSWALMGSHELPWDAEPILKHFSDFPILRYLNFSYLGAPSVFSCPRYSTPNSVCHKNLFLDCPFRKCQEKITRQPHR